MQSTLLVAICTYRRPLLLRRCLRSILSQLPGEGAPVRLAVIDNDSERSAAPVVSEESAASGFPVHYSCEAHTGIPYARNRAVELCLETGSGWLVFIDDDALAEPGWLDALQWATAHYSADVIAGPIDMPLPDPAPFWAVPQTHILPGEGAAIDVALTNNVAIRSGVFRERPALRFDTRMRFTGGSDTDFFRRLVAGGGIMTWSNRPRVSEPLSPERLTFRWQMNRKFRVACSKIYTYRKLRPLPVLYARRLPRAMWFLAMGAALLAGSMLVLPLWPERLRKPALTAGLQMSWALGTLAGLFGYAAQPYRPDRIGLKDAAAWQAGASGGVKPARPN